jgi:hypothetical protein
MALGIELRRWSLDKIRIFSDLVNDFSPRCLGSAGNGEATFAVSVKFRPFGAGIFKALGVYRPMTLVLCSAKSAGVIGLSDQFKTGPLVFLPVARFSTRKFGARIA